MADVLLVHNPEAGDGEHSADGLRSVLARSGFLSVYQSSQLDDFACALDKPWDLIVVAGGDGAVTRALRACAGRNVPVAVVPLGTANNVARGFGHVGEIGELVQRWDLNAHTSFYLGEARSTWGVSRFAEAFGIGLMAQTILSGEPEAHEQFRDRHEKLGTLSERLQDLIARLAPERLEISVDGQDYSGEYLWLEAGRVGFVGPNLPIAVEPDPWGRHLQIALLPVERRDQLLNCLKGGFGGASGALGLKLLRGTEATISWPTFRSHIDGVVLPRAGNRESAQTVQVTIHQAPVKVLTLR
jgi:diacylglycerol kinase (ATP)